MSDTRFFQTRMGQQFFERTAPDLVRQVERLAGALERVATKSVASVPSQVAAILEQIARDELGIETLQESRADLFDFHEVGVPGLRRALERRTSLAEEGRLTNRLLELPGIDPSPRGEAPQSRKWVVGTVSDPSLALG